MIACPEFSLNPWLYEYALPILSVISCIINPYVIYCIIWRSTSHMRRYRWFLLYHQIMAFIQEIFISFLAKPVIFIPLPVGYMTGILNGIVPAKYCLGIAFYVIFLSFGSILNLFCYRYETVKGTKRLFPPYMIALMVIGYSGALADPILIVLQPQKSGEAAEELINTYTCAMAVIFSMEDVCVYHWSTAMILGIAPIGSLMAYFIAIESVFFFLSYKETKRAFMSPKLKQMQRQFLLQLGLQAFLPFLIILVPAMAVIVVFSFGFFGYTFLMDCIFLALSAFGTIGGIVLIAMNPTYWSWYYRLRGRTNVATLSATNLREKSIIRQK